MKTLFSLLALIVFTGCSVNVVQNTGREADIMENNDKYSLDANADVDFNPDIEASVPLSAI